jgi:hypothetical protein
VRAEAVERWVGAQKWEKIWFLKRPVDHFPVPILVDSLSAEDFNPEIFRKHNPELPPEHVDFILENLKNEEIFEIVTTLCHQKKNAILPRLSANLSDYERKLGAFSC